jgi:3-oxoadipate enol-lactonase
MTGSAAARAEPELPVPGETASGGVPNLPPGRTVDLPGRGTTFIREVSGPPGAPVLILLHGWTVTADLNFFTAYDHLGQHFRVIALDHRGHGGGIRSREPFTLEACADDVAALADELAVDRFIPVGYSMGGTVAQLVWHRHRDRVSGLVLCSTARGFNATRSEAMSFFGLTGLATIARVAPEPAREWIADQFIIRKGRTYEDWALNEVRKNDITRVLEAGSTIGSFSSRDWIGNVDVPTAVVITTQDRTVPARRQLRLAESIPSAAIFRVPAAHNACYSAADRWVPAVAAACTDVASRIALNT